MLLEGDIIVIAARSIDFDESYMLVEEEVTKDTLEYGDTFIETKVDFLLTYFEKVVIIPSLTVLKYKTPFKPCVLAALEGLYISF